MAVMGWDEAMREIYFLSGLGADERVYQRLKYEGYQPKYIAWITPERKETIEEYALRLSKQIEGDRPILVGLSFGGMIAIEIAKFREVERIILISSIKNDQEMPPYFRVLKWVPLHRVFPFRLGMILGIRIAYLLFGTETVEERQLFKEILNSTDTIFFRWAIGQVVNWVHTEKVENLYHIHGNRDRVFPLRFLQSVDAVVEKGGHFMIFNRSLEISSLLENLISQISNVAQS